MTPRTSLASWQKLVAHAGLMKQQHMSELFANDSEGFDEFSIKLPPFLLDYSKNLISLAKDCNVEGWREKMFNGERINRTEDRAVLHPALRDRSHKSIILDGKPVNDHLQDALRQMKLFSEKVRQGLWKGYSGKRITDVVNIGVGGSNLGPQMVTEALKQYSDNSDNSVKIQGELESGRVNDAHDGSTSGLINFYHASLQKNNLGI